MVIWYVNPELHHVEFVDTLISFAPHTAKISVVHHFRLMQYCAKTITQRIREQREVVKVPFILKYEYVLIMKEV